MNCTSILMKGANTDKDLMTQENNLISPRLLDRLLATSCAAAAIILRGDKVVIKAGNLSAESFRTAESVLLNFDTSDVLRKFDHYVGVPLDQAYHLIFAKSLPQDEALLGLVFSSQMPLSQIRQDMHKLLHAIVGCMALGLGEDRLVERTLQSVLLSYPEPDPAPHTELSQSGWEPEVEHPVEQSEEPSVPQALYLSTQNNEQPMNEQSERAQSIGVEPQRMDESAPPMDMDVMMDEIPWQPIDEQWLADQEDNYDSPMIKQDIDPPKADESPQPLPQNYTWQPLTEIPHEGDDLISMLQDDFEMGREQPNDEEDFSPHHVPDDTADEEIAEQSLEDTNPICIEADEKSTAETIADTTFYLVPRMDAHYLLRDLSQQLRSWLPEICEIYGWQLDLLLIRPDYLKWTLRDFPESLVREMLTIVRIETSRRIFRVFPTLQEDNPTHDFWSPGYLVDTQNQEFSTQALISHISASRADG